jgi:hypothetical protein
MGGADGDRAGEELASDMVSAESERQRRGPVFNKNGEGPEYHEKKPAARVTGSLSQSTAGHDGAAPGRKREYKSTWEHNFRRCMTACRRKAD